MNSQQSNIPQPVTVFEAAGGEAVFQRITRRFYADVENDPLLRSMYPNDLAESILHLELFLIQYFGGPRTYHELRGHPRMRMRHMPFAIGQAERDAWMHHMRNSVQAEKLPQEIETILLDYFERTATFMMNR
jgi:hemoglobin